MNKYLNLLEPLVSLSLTMSRAVVLTENSPDAHTEPTVQHIVPLPRSDKKRKKQSWLTLQQRGSLPSNYSLLTYLSNRRLHPAKTFITSFDINTLCRACRQEATKLACSSILVSFSAQSAIDTANKSQLVYDPLFIQLA